MLHHEQHYDFLWEIKLNLLAFQFRGNCLSINKLIYKFENCLCNPSHIPINCKDTQMQIKLKADRLHLQDYLWKRTDYRHTYNTDWWWPSFAPNLRFRQESTKGQTDNWALPNLLYPCYAVDNMLLLSKLKKKEPNKWRWCVQNVNSK